MIDPQLSRDEMKAMIEIRADRFARALTDEERAYLVRHMTMRALNHPGSSTHGHEYYSIDRERNQPTLEALIGAWIGSLTPAEQWALAWATPTPYVTECKEIKTKDAG